MFLVITNYSYICWDAAFIFSCNFFGQNMVLFLSVIFLVCYILVVTLPALHFPRPSPTEFLLNMRHYWRPKILKFYLFHLFKFVNTPFNSIFVFSSVYCVHWGSLWRRLLGRNCIHRLIKITDRTLDVVFSRFLCVTFTITLRQQ